MCGFAGILNNSFAINKADVHEIAKFVSFRGPDNCGVSSYDKDFRKTDVGTSAIFFNRLAILDLESRSNQPFEDSRYTLVYNGEIYNYREIKEQLMNRGVNFKTTSDTEVLFYALQIWGKDCIPKLNGMFSFFWMDRKERYFLLARDRIGIKPLYYRQNKECFIFGSEVDSIIRLSAEKPEISNISISLFLWLQYIPTPYSIVKNIFKLPPGHYIEGTIEDLRMGKELISQSYWDAYEFINEKNNDLAEADLESLLVKSLEGQLQADVPVGLFLSSGIDSSLMTALVNKHFARDKKFSFFTVAFDEETVSDESKDVDKFIKGFNNTNLQSHKLEINADSIKTLLDTLYNYYDEPFGDPTSLLNWLISKKAKEHVTVVLSGEGADELFWGYPRYLLWRNQRCKFYKKLSFLRYLVKCLPDNKLKFVLSNKLEPDPVKIHFNFLRSHTFDFLADAVGNARLWCLNGIKRLGNHEDLVSIIDLKTYLVDAMLYKADRSGMAASLEVRVPYLDNNIVELALSLPLIKKSNAKYKDKAVLKELLFRLAPHYDINKQKKGFNFPLRKWMRHAWKDRILSTITKTRLEKLGLGPELFIKIINNHYFKSKEHTIEIWYVFNLLLWHEKFSKIQSLKASK